jgi:streptomycin 6-kinase
MMTAQSEFERLERVAREVAAEWQLELGGPIAMSCYSFVAPAGADAVLKVRSLCDDESDEEADALERWDGDGAVRLLRQDRERRAILLERARPGDDLSAVAEDEATAIAVEVGRRLWREAGEPFRWVGDHVPRWLADAERAAEAPASLIALGRELYASLEPGRSRLIHGDFHHHNILDAGGRHVAIDPKPMLGEPEFDIPSFLWNPLGQHMTVEVTQRRLAAFAEIGLDQWRMRAWTAVRGAYLGADDSDAEVIRALL